MSYGSWAQWRRRRRNIIRRMGKGGPSPGFDVVDEENNVIAGEVMKWARRHVRRVKSTTAERIGAAMQERR